MSSVPRTVAAILRPALALAFCFGSAAHAQECALRTEPAGLDEVRVTGSRIQRDGMTTPTPVTAARHERPARHVADDRCGGGDPAAAVHQQLGAGRRAGFGMDRRIRRQRPESARRRSEPHARAARWPTHRLVDRAAARIDVNLLPDSLVKSVEVVTGGASAAYGSDAVSGVVNFILDTKFTGFKTNIQGGITELGDNENFLASFAGGIPIGERAHLIASVDYYTADPIKDATRRDWQQSQGLINESAVAVSRASPSASRARTCARRQFTEGGLIVSGRAGTPAVEAVPAERAGGRLPARLGLHHVIAGRWRSERRGPLLVQLLHARHLARQRLRT